MTTDSPSHCRTPLPTFLLDVDARQLQRAAAALWYDRRRRGVRTHTGLTQVGGRATGLNGGDDVILVVDVTNVVIVISATVVDHCKLFLIMMMMMGAVQWLPISFSIIGYCCGRWYCNRQHNTI